MSENRTSVEEMLAEQGISEDQWPEILQQMALASCAFFASQYLSGPPNPPYNGRFLVDELHEEWSELINEHDRLCILASRNHGKSYMFSLAYPLWRAEKFPNQNGMIISNSEDQAVKLLSIIKDEVMENPNFEHLRPESTTRNWSRKSIRLGNGHVIRAAGFGTRTRGAHPDWIIIDDGLNDEDAYSEMARKRNYDYFMQTVMPMINPGGQVIVVGTPFAKKDLYGRLQDNEEFKCYTFAAIKPDGTALCPDRFKLEDLYKIKRTIGSIAFQREYLCQPVGEDSSLFPSRFFEGDPVEQHTVKMGMPWQWWEQRGVTKRYMGVDIAFSLNVGSDYTVLWTMGMDDHGNRWIIDIEREKGLGFQEQLSWITRSARKYNPHFIYLEQNAAQRVWGDELIRTTDLPIHTVHTGSQKHTLEKGIPSLRIPLENRKMRIPLGDERSRELAELWKGEMRSFTHLDGRAQSVGEHDDTVMAFWICETALREATFGFAFGEEEGDEEAYQEIMHGLPLPDVPWEDDDEFYLEEELDPGFIPGAGKVAGHKLHGANLVQRDTVSTEDTPKSALELKGAKRAVIRARKTGAGPKAEPGRPQPGDRYEDVRPDLGSPMASAFFGGNSI